MIVPLAPPRELLPNNRRRGGGAHWSVQATATTPYRTAAYLAAVAQRGTCGGGPLLTGPGVVVAYRVVWPWDRYGARRRLPDPDAIPTACKAVLDGLVDAGVLVDDGPEVIGEIRARGERGQPGEPGYTEVTVWTEVTA